MTIKEKSTRKRWNKKHLFWIIPLALLLAFAVTFLVYTGDYYRADETAVAALSSDGSVAVARTDYGWFFDGPSDENALIFYPGAKVEETAYAPLLHRLAAEGMDVCLVRMPFHLAFFGINKAGAVMKQYDYAHWYIGGHSLGGAMSTGYASKHGGPLDGVILFGAYAYKPLDKHLTELLIFGSEDGLSTVEKVEKARVYAPETYFEKCIGGGNHAQFGNYGIQTGDGTAAISAEEQQAIAVKLIIEVISTPAG